MTHIDRLIQAADTRAAAAAKFAQATVEALAKAAFAKMWRFLVEHPDADPREAIQAAQVEFGGGFSQALAEAFSELLDRTISPRELVAMPIAGLTLSRKLYLHNVTTAAEVLGVIREHAKGVHQARELSLALYDGYSPGDGVKRPLEGSARAALPKALRSLTDDPTARRTLTTLQVRGQQQAARLKSKALRAAYLESFSAWTGGAGTQALNRKLEVAQREKNRFFADRIAQTELHRAHMAQVSAELMAGPVEVVQVRMSPTHPRTDICDLHARADLWGLGPGCYPKEEAPLPPFHPFCLPGAALVSTGGRIAAVTRRWYEGDMVVIATASGKRLEATVNHPVLTGRGWVAAGLINVGGNVVSRACPERVEGGDVHDENVPTSIAQVFDSFGLTREVSTVEVPTAAPHFHGDGMAGHVAVVRADRKLWNGVNAALLQSLEDSPLVLGLQPSAGLSFPRHVELPLDASRLSPDGLMSGGSERSPLVSGEAVHADLLLLGGGAGDDAGSDDPGLERDSTDAEIALQILEGSTGEVFLDEVVSVHRYPVACHVYNLETTTHHYTSDGIVTHNCRCKLKSKPSLFAPPGLQPASTEGAFLASQGDDEAARIMGSMERWQRVQRGEPVEAIINEGKDPMYRLLRVGDAKAAQHPLVKVGESAV